MSHKRLNQTVILFFVPIAIMASPLALEGSPKLCKPLFASSSSRCQDKCQGIQGPIGPTGPMGPIGPNGLQGPPGQRGSNGPQGAAGPVGPQGPAGPVGPTGINGVNGITGPTGTQGERGQQGPPGPVGQTGPTGTMGDTGTLIGATGPTGVQGSQGAPGPSQMVVGYAYARTEGPNFNAKPGVIIPLDSLETHSAGFALSVDGRVQVPFNGIYLIYYQIMSTGSISAALQGSQTGVIGSGVFANQQNDSVIAGSTVTHLMAEELVGMINNDTNNTLTTATSGTVPINKPTTVAMTIVCLVQTPF
jgi:Collagen triple helix repeat (20 copies)